MQQQAPIYWTSVYIISNTVANNVKDRYYTEGLSTIENVRPPLFLELPPWVQPNFRISNIVREIFASLMIGR
jgi:hypothetical protein